MREIEILVEVLGEFDDAKQKLDNFVFKGSKLTHDIYFFDSLRKELQSDASGRLHACLRLRHEGEDGLLTYKVDHFLPDGSWSYSDEHETGVEDYEVAGKIIEHLGLEPLVEIKSHKYKYINDKYEIVLEDVENLGYFLEVELLKGVDDSQVKIAKAEIWQLIKSIGILVGPELDMGKPEMMLRKTKLK